MKRSTKDALKRFEPVAFNEDNNIDNVLIDASTAISSIKEKQNENLQKLLIQFESLCNKVQTDTTLLISAINEGNIQAVNILLKCENIDVGAEAKKRTAVDAAARNNMADLVWILTALSPKGKPFLSAIEGGHAKLAEALMQRLYSSPEDAARDHRGDFTLPVHLASSIECLKLVLSHSNVNSISFIYGTPLQAAISLKHFEVAEYLVDHVPEVEFEPDSWRTSLMKYSPLILAMKSECRSLVEKLLNSGKCQQTLDSIVNFPTPDELLGLYDRYWSGKQSEEDLKPTVVSRVQEITYIPPTVSKEQYLNTIFKLLDVTEPDRVLSYTERDYHLKEKPPQSIALYEYNLEECPIECIKEYLQRMKLAISDDMSHQDLLAAVRKSFRTHEDNFRFPSYQRYHTAADPSTAKILRLNSFLEPDIREFVKVKKLFGYFERSGLRYQMELDLTTQNGSREFLDQKILVNGQNESHRTHLFNQYPMYTQTNYLQQLISGGIDNVDDSLTYRFISVIILNAFSTKTVVEKVELGVELTMEALGWSTSGKFFANNGLVYIFVARRLNNQLDKLHYDFTDTDDNDYDEDDPTVNWPLPRVPYRFFLGEVKTNPAAENNIDKCTIEGIWWETTLEKYSEADVLKEENFSVKGAWKMFSPTNSEETEGIEDAIRIHNAETQN